jgi:hypothetical protein
MSEEVAAEATVEGMGIGGKWRGLLGIFLDRGLWGCYRGGV